MIGVLCLLFIINVFQTEANESIMDVFPQQNQLDIHGSSIQFFHSPESKDGTLFVVWSQGDWEGNDAQIFGSMYTLDSNSWTQPQPLTAKDFGHPDINPVLYIHKDNNDQNQLYLFWVKTHTEWEEIEIQKNTATLNNGPITSFQDLKWKNPHSQGETLPIWLSSNASPMHYNALKNTWPLKGDTFNPNAYSTILPINLENFLQMYHDLFHILFPCFDPFSSIFTMSPSNILATFTEDLYNMNQNIQQIALKQLSHPLNAISPDPSLTSDPQSDTDLLCHYINVLYRMYSIFVYEKMQICSNPKSQKWKINNTPIASNHSNKRRIILPIYSEKLDLSGIIYSDDDGSSWEQAKTFITGRKATQPAIAQLSGGALMACMKNNGASINLNKMLTSYSQDGGNTWSTAIPCQQFPNYSSSVSIIKLHHGRHQNTLALVYNDDRNKRNLTLALSKDNGNSWTQKVLKQSKKEETFDSFSIAQATNGKLYISFTHKIHSKKPTDLPDSCPYQNIGVICIDPLDILFD